MVLIEIGIGFLSVYLINNEWLQYQCQAMAWIYEEFEYLRRQFEIMSESGLTYCLPFNHTQLTTWPKTLIESPNPN